jgi:hypothetical protein
MGSASPPASLPPDRCGRSISSVAARRLRVVVGHGQLEAEQAEDRADQALGLAVGEAEHGAQGERRQDGEGRIPGLPARGRARLRCPPLDRLGAEPHGQATAPA